MNNKEQLTMKTVTVLSKILIDAWHTSKCPDKDEAYSCSMCKYNELCGKIIELEKLVNK